MGVLVVPLVAALLVVALLVVPPRAVEFRQALAHSLAHHNLALVGGLRSHVVVVVHQTSLQVLQALEEVHGAPTVVGRLQGGHLEEDHQEVAP